MRKVLALLALMMLVLAVVPAFAQDAVELRIR